jgi:hypothetical protein
VDQLRLSEPLDGRYIGNLPPRRPKAEAAPSSVEIFYRALRTETQRIGGLTEVWPTVPVAVRDRTVALVSEFFT